MILADTSIVIEFTRKPSLSIAHVIVTGKPAVCGITVTEVHAGAQPGARRSDATATLRLFRSVPIEPPVWELAGQVSRAMTRRGTKIQFQISVIAATAIYHDLPLWTRDKHFAWVQEAFPALSLFDDAA